MAGVHSRGNPLTSGPGSERRGGDADPTDPSRGILLMTLCPFVVVGLDLRGSVLYLLSHTLSPFCPLSLFFQIGSHNNFALAGLKP